jgi:uncharacterized protein (UPF0548 family)
MTPVWQSKIDAACQFDPAVAGRAGRYGLAVGSGKSTPFTYEQVGATRDELLPSGYAHVSRDVVIGHGPTCFHDATEALLGWQMHREAGLSVAADAARATAGTLVVLRAGWGPLSITIPCRVVYSVDSKGCRGFAYGTLPGHPEQGEEAFTVRLTQDKEVRLRIRAFSRPATALARAGGPFTRLVQEYVTDRYVRSLRALADRASRA